MTDSDEAMTDMSWKRGARRRPPRRAASRAAARGAGTRRERERDLGDFAPSEVVAPRNDGAARTAKYQAALDGGHDVLVLISEVWGGRGLRK